jgi:hypothetical protein
MLKVRVWAKSLGVLIWLAIVFFVRRRIEFPKQTEFPNNRTQSSTCDLGNSSQQAVCSQTRRKTALDHPPFILGEYFLGEIE